MVENNSNNNKGTASLQQSSSNNNAFLDSSVHEGYEIMMDDSNERQSRHLVKKQRTDNPQCDDGQSSLVRISRNSDVQNQIGNNNFTSTADQIRMSNNSSTMNHVNLNLQQQNSSQSKQQNNEVIKGSGAVSGEGAGQTTLDALTEESPSKTETESPSPVKGKGKANKLTNYNDPPLVINITYTQYELIHEVAQALNWRTSIDEEDDWDIWFIDGPTIPALLVKMKSYQRTNHFPGMYALARKNLLAKNLISMQKYFPHDFNFFPKTWLLPQDIKQFKEQFNYRKAKTFIIKPEASCQGKGIFLTRNFEWIQQGEHYVAQRYLHKPFLVDNLKFDLRIYVLITSVIPLRIFIYKEGLARFATQDYVSPLGSNLNNLCMHLTNYAINKESEDFVQNTGTDNDFGHKRSLTSIFRAIDAAREKDPEIISSEECWQQLKELTVKTIISGHNQISHIQRTAKPQDLENQLCFQILGIDIFLDKKAKPWLIEVNQSPSFLTDSPLDHKVKKGVLVDSFRMLNLSWRRKNRYINNARIEKQRRLQGLPRASNYEKEETRQKKIRIKDKHELNHLGDYERIYPLQPEHLRDNEYNIALQDRYDELIHYSKDVWSESANGGFQRKKIDPTNKPILNKGSSSPDKPRELTKKDTSNTIGGGSSVKKTIVKLHSVPTGELVSGTQNSNSITATKQLHQAQSHSNDGGKGTAGKQHRGTPLQAAPALTANISNHHSSQNPGSKEQSRPSQKILIKDSAASSSVAANGTNNNQKSPIKSSHMMNSPPSTFANGKLSESSQALGAVSYHHQNQAVFSENRKDSSDQAFVLVNGKQESIQQQQQQSQRN